MSRLVASFDCCSHLLETSRDPPRTQKPERDVWQLTPAAEQYPGQLGHDLHCFAMKCA